MIVLIINFMLIFLGIFSWFGTRRVCATTRRIFTKGHFGGVEQIVPGGFQVQSYIPS